MSPAGALRRGPALLVAMLTLALVVGVSAPAPGHASPHQSLDDRPIGALARVIGGPTVSGKRW